MYTPGRTGSVSSFSARPISTRPRHMRPSLRQAQGPIIRSVVSRPAPAMITQRIGEAFGSFMTSYARARAESLIPRCTVGFLERPERIVLLVLGAVSNRMAAALWIIAVLSNLTALQRVVYTYVELKKGWARMPEQAPALRRARS